MKTALTLLIGGVIGFLIGSTIDFIDRFDTDYFNDDIWDDDDRIL